MQPGEIATTILHNVVCRFSNCCLNQHIKKKLYISISWKSLKALFSFWQVPDLCRQHMARTCCTSLLITSNPSNIIVLRGPAVYLGKTVYKIMWEIYYWVNIDNSATLDSICTNKLEHTMNFKNIKCVNKRFSQIVGRILAKRPFKRAFNSDDRLLLNKWLWELLFHSDSKWFWISVYHFLGLTNQKLVKTKTREPILTDVRACMQSASVFLVFINLATEVVTHNVAGCFHFNKIQAGTCCW